MTVELDNLKSISVKGVELKRIIDVKSGRTIWVPHDYRYKIYVSSGRWSSYNYGR